MIDFYLRLSVVEYGIDPIEFWNYTPKEIDLISERKLKEHREKHEFEAWKISWLLSPHVKDAVKPSDIYDYDRIKADSEMTPEEEFDNFDNMFISSEEKQAKQKKEVADALRRINAKAKIEREEAEKAGLKYGD